MTYSLVQADYVLIVVVVAKTEIRVKKETVSKKIRMSVELKTLIPSLYIHVNLAPNSNLMCSPFQS